MCAWQVAGRGRRGKGGGQDGADRAAVVWGRRGSKRMIAKPPPLVVGSLKVNNLPKVMLSAVEIAAKPGEGGQGGARGQDAGGAGRGGVGDRFGPGGSRGGEDRGRGRGSDVMN